MSVAEPQPAVPKRNPRWFQYSLRTLLIVVTLFAIPCSWLAVKRQQAKREREAAAEIVKLGGVVHYDWQCDAKGRPLRWRERPPLASVQISF